MRRTSEFDAGKLMLISTKTTVTNVYVDSFPIEKIRLQNANYQTKEHIDIYMDFSDFLEFSDAVLRGKVLKDLESGQQITIHRGGTTNSKKYNGQPEARTVTLGMMNNTVFLNMTSGKGALTATGAITPDGPHTTKISVGMSYQDLRRMCAYASSAISSYLPNMINEMLNNVSKNRNKV